MVPVPEILKASGWPAVVFEATCTTASDCRGSCIDLKFCAGPGRELHGLGQHHDKVLSAVQRLGIKAGLAAVGHVIADLELSFAGPQRENESVAVLLLSAALEPN